MFFILFRTNSFYPNKRKYQNLTKQKQRVHTKMQTENTLLIAECNRLRKNLHEVYQEVMKIENDFLQLTKINPELGKAEIVKQINMFIRDTVIFKIKKFNRNKKYFKMQIQIY